MRVRDKDGIRTFRMLLGNYLLPILMHLFHAMPLLSSSKTPDLLY